MRIISGRFRGRPLVSFKASHIRPTTDRVKESIFNKLNVYWDESRVLDLYSGTGNLTLEALSWGATHVTSVESHDKSIEIIRKNLSQFKVTSQVTLRKYDVLKFLKEYSGPPFDVILVDPPFTKKLADQSMDAVSVSGVFHRDTVIVIESSGTEVIKDEYQPFVLWDRKNFGDKVVSFFHIGQP